ncbi:putative enzyme related to lactoylglutathione lyase [Kitasatospora sp. MAP12-15]|uniref:VOC family protein n=1 Tax=unclassified Kitasatospora TaxID=2633591 RepID=UPI002473D186|nr:VOC family protein [Kitasatospora sp. MAP12-44]MDH6110652.1 putative enzyme related to lactoylglutathione lyase [Kitasatospora sp. MAP12-44]
MPMRDSYPDGAPCWTDLTTSDPAGARAFYGPILGWEFQDNGPEYGGYQMCLSGGRPVAALMPPPPGGEQLPTMWNVYLSTSDLDTVYGKVDAAGGKPVMGPHDVPGAGRMAFAFDPTGASVGFWQPAGHIGAALYGEPGAMCWNELNTPDGAVADAFYAQLFPYRQEQIGDGADFDYTDWRLPAAPETPVCGRYRTAVAQPYWSTYFAVADADRAAAQVRELGGRLVREPFDTPYGRMVPCTDRGGAQVTFCRP